MSVATMPVATKMIDLEPEDAMRVQELAEEFYPESFDQDLSEITKSLSGSPDESFCFGIEQGDELVGYMIAWISNTFIDGREEEVIVIDDLVVRPTHRSGLFRLLEELRYAAEDADIIGMPVEACLRVPLAQSIAKHGRLLSRLGYHLVGGHHYHDEGLGEDIVWIRFGEIEEAQALPLSA
jgi:hypothetical protein